MSVLTDLRNRGVKDTFFVVCDGLKGLPEVVGHVWPLSTVQTCIIHLIRNTFRLASRKDWDALKHDVKPIYTAVNAEAARAALEELTEKWGPKYGAIIRLWNNAWEEFIPFLDYDVEIRTVLCSTNAWVILSFGDDRGCDLQFCVVDGVCDAVAQHDLVGLGIGGLGVSCRGSRVVMARRSPRASARAWRRRVLSVSSSRMRCVATSMRRSREASEERWRSGTGRAAAGRGRSRSRSISVRRSGWL